MILFPVIFPSCRVAVTLLLRDLKTTLLCENHNINDNHHAENTSHIMNITKCQQHELSL